MTLLISNKTNGVLGTARVPGDKSISHRALILGAVAEGTTEIYGLLESEDILHTAQALQTMGVKIQAPDKKAATWRVTGTAQSFQNPKTTIYLGNSGTAARLLMGLVAGQSITATFTGDASLQKRPMGRVIKPLGQMGARFEVANGDRMPLRVIGRGLRAIRYTLPVASAQVKSAILLAALRTTGQTVITEPMATRDHTERMLKAFGANISTTSLKDGAQSILFKSGRTLSGMPLTIPGDASAAAFLMVAALITPASDLLIPRVGINPRRTGFCDTLLEMGADISFENRTEISGEPVADIRVRSSRLSGTTVPPDRVPAMIDEFPALAVAAAYADGETLLQNLSELRVKESDRFTAIVRGLSMAGIEVTTSDDNMTIHGRDRPPVGGCTIDAELDHRIAMSFLILGMGAEKPVAVIGADTIASSFPGFQQTLNNLGADIRSEA